MTVLRQARSRLDRSGTPTSACEPAPFLLRARAFEVEKGAGRFSCKRGPASLLCACSPPSCEILVPSGVWNAVVSVDVIQ